MAHNYRSGVKVGNWYEDELGTQLGARTMQHAAFAGKSESQAAFAAPSRQQPPKHNQAPAFAAVTGTSRDVVMFPASKAHMPRHLLFNHGVKPEDPTLGSRDMYMSVYVSCHRACSLGRSCCGLRGHATAPAAVRAAKQPSALAPSPSPRSQAAHSKHGSKVSDIIAGSRGCQPLSGHAPETRRTLTQTKAKMAAAGVSSSDPRGAPVGGHKPTPNVMNSSSTFVTTAQLSSQALESQARLTRALGRLPSDVTEGRVYKPRTTQFTSTYKDMYGR